ncbi:MAG: bifunctional phosphopantothenoylcysteine decarboxylase/phosphopantothenate--cysteine ligase CoaBC [Cyanobacteria bacterium]|nr:bifunctional phosphopantothenoylcysteine decarboxylase/phosphopantothenate--cysteine ligase CoaBC [Cyanobacteriota bacterium]
MDFSGKTIAIGVCGGIAAYRVCDLIRECYRRGATRVIPLMSKGAEAFITPLTLEALSRETVIRSSAEYLGDLPSLDSQLEQQLMDGLSPSGTPMHIQLAQDADVLVVIPATANMLAKLAYGLADDAVSTTAITWTAKPMLVVPAMNTRMWEHPATQVNIKTLTERSDVSVLLPSSGLLACGEVGDGHLPTQEQILQAIYRAVHPDAQILKGVRALVTAGGTQEMLDPVRVLTNRSSGKMGLAFARELDAMGALVTLIATEALKDKLSGEASPGFSIHWCASALEMSDVVNLYFEETDWLVMAAAVSDFTLENPSAQKHKREHKQESGKSSWEVSFTATEDILKGVAAKKRPGQFILGFAAETEPDAIALAEEKCRRKGVDALALNDVSRSDIGFEASDNEMTLVFPSAERIHFPKASKDSIARQIILALLKTGAGPNSRKFGQLEV